MAYKKIEGQINKHSYTVSVVGLSGTESVKGRVGVGKSCLCNRFVRPAEDDFHNDHLSLLSAADFNGQVINNDHWLYWGLASRLADDGTEYSFNVVEQTEFLDDTTFAPLRGGKTDPYLKRCSQIKIQSAEKLMYICRDQLGLEDQFPEKKFPTGKVAVDGFVCVVDVSRSQDRSLESQLEFLSKILSALVKTKKPIVMAATKMDEGSEAVMLDVQKLLGKKSIPLIETSALNSVNIDLPFMLLASLIDKTRTSKPKIISYAEANKLRQDKLDAARQAYGNVLNTHITDYRSLWRSCTPELEKFDDFTVYVELFGLRKARSLFVNRVAQLRQEYITKRKAEYLGQMPGLLEEFFPTLASVAGRPWHNCVRLVFQRPSFQQKFVSLKVRWTDDDDFLESGDKRIPVDLFGSQEVEAIFSQHVKALQAEVQRQEYKRQFADFVNSHRSILPGAPLEEMEVHFMGRDFYNGLSQLDRADVYRTVQQQLREKAKKEFLELLYERMDIFYKYDDPDTPITQEDVEALMSLLRSEPKCKALSRCEEDRKVIMLNHLGFLQYPIKEQCPFRQTCMEVQLQKCLAAKQKRSQDKPVLNWSPNPQEKIINLILIGAQGLSSDLVQEIRYHYGEDEYPFDDKVYNLDYRTIDGDVSLPHNSLKTPDFLAHGCICVFSNRSNFEFIADSLDKTFLAASDDRLQYEGLPVVLMKAYDSSVTEKEHLRLSDDARTLAHRLKCEFVDLPELYDHEEISDCRQFSENQVPRAMRDIAIQMSSNDTVDTSLTYSSNTPHADIRLLMCHMCSDPYSVDTVLQPFLVMQSCNVVTNNRYHVIQFDTFISDVKRKVEVILASYHEATLLKDEYCHGYILCYSTKRKSSCSMLESFISKIPPVPSLVVAVNDSVHTDTTISLTNKGRFIAENHNCLFITTTDFYNQSPYTLLLKEVWELHQRRLSIQTESFTSGSLDTYNSYYSPQDSGRQSATIGVGGRKQWEDSRAGIYLGGTWADNNEIYLKNKMQAPLAERIEMLDYEEPPDALSDTSEEYALVQDALPDGKIQRVQSTLKRDFRPAFPHTDSESDMSSLERNVSVRSPVNRRRTVMPKHVASGVRRALSPSSPRLNSNTTERKSSSLPRIIFNRVNTEAHWDGTTSNSLTTNTMKSDTPSEGSESAGDEVTRSGNEVKRNRSLRMLRRRKIDGPNGEDETNFFERFKNSVTTVDPEKQRRKSMRRKQKEEEKVLRDKQKSVRRKLKSRLKRQSYLSNKGSGMTLQDYLQTEGNLIPMFVELCVKHLEGQGLSMEGLYRIPGNTAQVELLKEMFQHNKNIDISTIDIGINAVATALKGFFSDLAEPLIPAYLNQELVVADTIPEKSSRLLALRGVLKKLPPANHEILKYLVTHLYRVHLNSEVNSMDSKNLAICWWPTIIRAVISNVNDLKSMGKAMEEITITLIEQHGFFFYNEHEV